MKKNIALAFILTLLLVCVKLATYPNCQKIKADLKYKYEFPQQGDLKFTYEECYNFEKENGINFLKGKAKTAKLYSGIFNFSKKVSEEKTERLIEVLNDSASYEWGEVGTFIHDKIILFYDKSGKIIGMTEMDDGFQTYSVPSTKTMKWGTLSKLGYEEISKIIE